MGVYVFSKDIMREHLYRRKVIENPTTEEAHFWITPFEDRHFIDCVKSRTEPETSIQEAVKSFTETSE